MTTRMKQSTVRPPTVGCGPKSGWMKFFHEFDLKARFMFSSCSTGEVVGVRIRPRINHMKLDKYTQRLLLSPSVRIARSKLFPFYCSLTLGIQYYNLTACLCINTQPAGQDLQTDLH
jgi:hypothetical protein